MDDITIEKLQTPDGYRAVIKFKCPSVKLKGFLAIHNEDLGPAVGGTRMFPYANEQAALIDVLRLSRAMTYKCALAGVHHGGGKAVIIGDPEKDKSEALIRAYAKVIESLKGRFHTGEDVGISEDDVQIMLQESKFFIGRRGVAGDPSPFASLSTFYTMQVAAREKFGNQSLWGLTVAIKGAGKVGSELIRLVKKDGAKVIAADVRPSAVEKLKAEHPDIKIVSAQKIHSVQADIFSPCALGNDITMDNVGEIKAKVICGGANNQLASIEIGDELFKRDILFVPDYIANAGGLIDVVAELEPDGYNRERVIKNIENVKNTISTVLLMSRQKKRAPSRIADRLAEETFHNAGRNGHN